MSEAELFYRLGDDRLRSRCRWAGTALVATILLPYEVIDEQPQFLWQLFDELPVSGVVAGLAPMAAGLAILVGRHFTKRATSLALIVVGALSATALLHKLGADASAWGLLPLPHSFTGRATSALLALALTAAGANLAFRKAQRKAAKVALIGGVVAAAFFYAWPGRGEAPGVTVLHNLAAIGDMPTVHFKLGALTLTTVALWPAIIPLVGLVHLRKPPTRSLSVLGMVALAGFPLILMMLLFSWYVRSSPGSAVFAALGGALEISAILALLSAAFEALGQGVLGEDAGEAIPAGWPPARMAGATLGVLLVLGGVQWWLARPPDKGVDWTLAPPSEAADELFAKLVVSWSNARWSWDLRVRRDSSAAALLEVKSRGRKMVEAAEQIDAELGKALGELHRAGWRLDVSSRGWYRLVAQVNRACRKAQLPYYLDPQVSISKTKDGLRRHFLVRSYRVEQVRRFDVDGEIHAALHVRGFGTLRGGHRSGLLGFSRDIQPFALVVLDSTDELVARMGADAAQDPPRCGDTFDLSRHDAMLRCGTILKDLMADEKVARRAAVGIVERHELQHQIDGPLLALAKPVLKKLAGYTDTAKERVNRELSAYVAQLTGAPAAVKLGLITPFRFAVLQDRGTYHHAAVLLFEALGRRPVRDAFGDVDHQQLTEVFAELCGLDDAALRARAAEAWDDLFGEELLPVTALDTTVAPGSAPAGTTSSATRADAQAGGSAPAPAASPGAGSGGNE